MEIGSRPLKTEFFRFVIPSILSQWVYALYNMVDGMFVARGVGELALTAVNLSNPFLQFMFATSLLFAVGTSTVAAIFMGDNQRRRARTPPPSWRLASPSSPWCCPTWTSSPPSWGPRTRRSTPT